MVYDFLVIGATGAQGRIATRDLLQSGYSVVLAGRDKSRIEHIIKKYKRATFAYLDLRDKSSIIDVIKNSGVSVVVNCADGDYDLDVLNACIKVKANCLDLGSGDSITLEQLKLDKVLRRESLIAITGCGSVPGIGSVMAGYASEKFDKIEKIYAGFAWDSNMKVFVVPYSIDTIAEEFTYKSPIIKNGRMKLIEPGSYVLDRNFMNIGKQRVRCMMHQEIYSFYNSFKNKGVKEIIFYGGFPEHSYNTIMNLIELGLCSKDYITVDGKKHRMIDCLTEALKKLSIPKGYKELEDLWVTIVGKKNGRKKKIEMVCTAGTLKGWEDATCNIDTGMPISIMAQMIKKGTIKAKGSFSPELIVPSNIFFKELAKRKMYVYENGRKIN